MPKAAEHAEKCMICALEAYAAEVQTWLAAGGDKRLLEFAPLDAWGKVLHHLSAMQSRGETQHLH